MELLIFAFFFIFRIHILIVTEVFLFYTSSRFHKQRNTLSRCNPPPPPKKKKKTEIFITTDNTSSLLINKQFYFKLQSIYLFLKKQSVALKAPKKKKPYFATLKSAMVDCYERVQLYFFCLNINLTVVWRRGD